MYDCRHNRARNYHLNQRALTPPSAGGALKPTRELLVRDKQRVRLTVETIDEPGTDRAAAIERLKAGIASMRFVSEGPLPSREELHNRR